MSECIIGVERCGCITYANARPDTLDRGDEHAIARVVRGGGHIERLTTDQARARPHFLAFECPHNPKGWEREEPKKPDPIIYKHVSSRCLSVVYARIEGWEARGFRAGEVGKRDGQWWATEGWLQDNATAMDGKSPRGPMPVLGPFSTQREAAEALVPLAEQRGAALQAEWATQGTEEATTA